MSGQLQTQLKAPTEPYFRPIQSSLLQRKCACGNHAMGGECEECKGKKGLLQHGTGNESAVREVPPIVDEVLRSPGKPLDAATKGFMESRFDHDFSQVRIHTDAKAAESTQAVNALAYTVGRDVVFGAGQYTPTHDSGRKLLAHELAHVVQQSGSQNNRQQATSCRALTQPFPEGGTSSTLAAESYADPLELEADRASNAVLNSRVGIIPNGIIKLKNPSLMLSRQIATSKPTKQEQRESALRQMAIRPSEALQKWSRLKQNERDTILWEIISRYGADFATDFLEYATRKKKPNFLVEITNLPNVTPEGLIKRGYRFAGDIARTGIWVHPSGSEIWMLPSSRRGPPPPEKEEGKTEGDIQTRCVDPCLLETEDEDECNKCCEERIPESDAKCRRACEFGCSTKL